MTKHKGTKGSVPASAKGSVPASAKGSVPASAKSSLPTVSVCTPTFNRRPFIASMLACFRHQTYPRNRIVQWIILDDGFDPIGDLLPRDEFPMIEYHRVDKKQTLGWKRNRMHDLAKGDILVYMDDDDYYPPERIQHAVEVLQANPAALCVGASEIYCYFKHISEMVQFGPYGPNHATAGTFAFRRQLLALTRYDDKACLAEERAFLKDYTIPFAQLDPRKTILVFSHDHNTFDKRRMLQQRGPQNPTIKETSLTVDDFIRQPFEAGVKQFFLHDIDGLLSVYEPGRPVHKPDVIKQTIELEAQRKALNEEMARKQQQAMTPINVIDPATGQKVHLTMEQVVNLIRDLENKLNSSQNQVLQQRQYIQQQAEAIQRLELCLNAGAEVPSEVDPLIPCKAIEDGVQPNQNESLPDMLSGL
jgi:hypothetical protein